ncbi:hypothetical protein GL2_30020 [Microbulbifer sp. GL-2]|nr:hypothetical protein GL2_30020 [Microbulbifer sp. GL-2]
MSAAIVSSGEFIRTYDPSFKPSERLIAGTDKLEVKIDFSHRCATPQTVILSSHAKKIQNYSK